MRQTMAMNNELVRTIRRSCDEGQVTDQVIDPMTRGHVTEKVK